ncbi:crossover junction endodeoxyribonuclease RuvC [Megalodesulfovibrio gigas]|uniref:Crossover junction endodeoxyribonuclease RuvC n=1 Tax=Megalodesulfovibrio gigas (strain ATCC 19364 / DSM 1382 / NCIMB 9332 / VKM B-1759) TaxID=1121448 RepID=T2GFR2_MEGG1|nr:crossover junction endodeoxyribonuclease RuvC [Megalodesulfovibrio gigas]AGW15128.1 putative crossover junction endodeoxyribonuclease RuvC [Megalodesulfovibrio gigas DSM 1382 = ATCC 19364]
MTAAVRVLGIDPGSRVAGYAVVEERSGKACLVEAGTLRPDPSLPMAHRLARLYRGVADLIDRHAPHEAAMEEIFTAKNAASALVLGQARGAILAACGVLGLPVTGYEPSVVKKTLVGTGRADKEQVAFMVRRILAATEGAYAMDATDAMAVAVCHLNHRRFARLTATAETTAKRGRGRAMTP